MKLIKLAYDPIEKVFEGLVRDEVENAKNYKTPPRRFRASEVAHCRRRIWYRLAGFRPTPDEPWLELVADSGGMHHDYTRHIANHYGVGLTGFTEEEGGKQVEDKYLVGEFTHDHQTFRIAAQADAGLEIEPGMATVEIKSMSHFKHDSLQKAFAKGGEEAVFAKLTENHIEYLWQGMATAIIKGVKYVYLVLVGRSGNSLGLSDAPPARQGVWDPLRGRRRAGAVFEIEESDRANLLQKLADIDRALDNGEPPPPDFVDGSQPCNQCPFWRKCHGLRKTGGKYPVDGVE